MKEHLKIEGVFLLVLVIIINSFVWDCKNSYNYQFYDCK